MTIKEIERLLATANFIDPDDRLYWVDRLAELKRKQKNAEQNAEYFKKMSVYDRL